MTVPCRSRRRWELIRLANRASTSCSRVRASAATASRSIRWFIVHSAPERTPLIQAARHVNGGKPLWVAEQVLAACPGIEAPVIACLGLAYKADVGDLRECWVPRSFVREFPE
ncbi:MAG: hypothetical protein OXJ90_13750 [Spirochaetaceae bacterium]|nr:hypothetical protein [Spirochaetaceae bacterium]